MIETDYKIAKSDRVRQGFRVKYTKQQFTDGCQSAYRLGLMDGEQQSVVKLEVHGLYSQVRIRRVKQRKPGAGRNTDPQKTPHYVQLRRKYDDKWVSIALCDNQDEALAVLEDVVLILARAGIRKAKRTG